MDMKIIVQRKMESDDETMAHQLHKQLTDNGYNHHTLLSEGARLDIPWYTLTYGSNMKYCYVYL